VPTTGMVIRLASSTSTPKLGFKTDALSLEAPQEQNSSLTNLQLTTDCT